MASSATFVRQLFSRSRGRQTMVTVGPEPATHELEFSIELMSSDEVRAQSCFEVTDMETTDPITKLPKEGGLDDPRGGAQDNVLCQTCNNGSRDLRGRSLHCMGHPGHIELPEPVVHPHHVSTVRKLLHAVCFSCGSCLLPESWRKKVGFLHSLETITPMQRISLLAAKCSRRRACSVCKLPTQPTWACVDKLFVRPTWVNPVWANPSATSEMSAEEAASWQQQVDQCDTWMLLRLLSRAFAIEDPQWNVRSMLHLPTSLKADSLLVTALAVIPKTARPAYCGSNKRYEPHDLTKWYKFILRPVLNLKKLLRIREQWQAGEVTEAQVREALNDRSNQSVKVVLNTHIEFNRCDIPTQMMMLTDNRTTKLPMQRKHRHGASSTPSSLAQFLGSKMGIVRRRMPNGAVRQSARAPLSPSPRDWSIEEVGVPHFIATLLSVPERVTVWNRARLKEAVRRGAGRLRGCDFVQNESGEGVDMRHVTRRAAQEIAKNLELGWVVYRYITDGDMVIANRAPSLHCMNVMALRVRVLDSKHDHVIRVHHALARHFNMDFDGDMMMLHACQSLQARIEMALLMRASRYVVDPCNSMPIMTPTINTPLAMFLLTDDAVVLDMPQVWRLLRSVSTFHDPQGLMRRLDVWRYKVDTGGSLVKTETIDADDSRGCITTFAPASHQNLWRGRDVLSALLPNDLFYGPLRQDPSDPRSEVVVEAGRILRGQWRAKHVLAGPRSITQAIERCHGQQEACRFVNSIQAMGGCYLEFRGYSAGAADMLQTDACAKDARELTRRIRSARREVERGTTRNSDKRRVMMATLRAAAMSTSEALTRHHAFTENPRGRDNLMDMVDSGAKGDVTKLAQMRFMLGDQMGAFANLTADGAMSTLPCFKDLPPQHQPLEASGMVFQGYGSLQSGGFFDKDTDEYLGGGHAGPSPAELFAHAACGINALTGTTCGVPKTGEMQNNLAGGGEAMVCCGNLPSRAVFTDAVMAGEQRSQQAPHPHQVQQMHRIVQFAAGGDSLDPMAVRRVSIQALKGPIRDLRHAFVMDAPARTPEALTIWHLLEACRRRIHASWTPQCAAGVSNGQFPHEFAIPFSAAVRLRSIRLALFGTHGEGDFDTLPRREGSHEVGEAWQLLRDEFIRPCLLMTQATPHAVEHLELHAMVTHPMFMPGLLPLCVDVLWHLRPWRLSMGIAARREVLLQCLQRLRYCVMDSLVMDGEACGLKAAYALGRKMTQDELDKKHYVAHADGGNGLSSLQRIRELVSLDRGSGHEPSSAAETVLTFRDGVSLAQATAWANGQVIQSLASLLLPAAVGGQLVLHLPTDASQLRPCECRAWLDSWNLMQPYAAMGQPSMHVLVVRIDKERCLERNVALSSVVSLLRTCVWSAASAGNSTAPLSDPLAAWGPSSRRPIIIPTMPTDDTWSVVVGMRDWTVIADAVDIGDIVHAAGADAEPLVVAAMGMMVQKNGHTIRGSSTVRSVSVFASPRWDVNHRAGTVRRHETEPDVIQATVRGVLPPARVAKLHAQGLVDVYTSSWTSVHMVHTAFGIEAARETWLREMRKVVQSDVSVQHLELLADAVCFNGAPHSMVVQPRVGRNGFMQAASSGFTLKVLREAALVHAREHGTIKGVMYSGRAPRIGSLMSDVVMDPRAEVGLQHELVKVWEAEMVSSVSKQLEAIRISAAAAPPAAAAAPTQDDLDVLNSDAPPTIATVPMIEPSTAGSPLPAAATAYDEGGDSDEPMDMASVLPHGSTAADFVCTAIQSVIPIRPSTTVLPPGSTTEDFPFVGTRDATRAQVSINASHTAAPEVLRRLHGLAAAAVCAPEKVEDGNGCETDDMTKVIEQQMDDRAVFYCNSRKHNEHAPHSPSAESNLTVPAMHIVRRHQRESRVQRAAHLNMARARLNPAQRREFDLQGQRDQRAKTAKRARERRSLQKAASCGQLNTHRLDPSSPRFVARSSDVQDEEESKE